MGELRDLLNQASQPQTPRQILDQVRLGNVTLDALADAQEGAADEPEYTGLLALGRERAGAGATELVEDTFQGFSEGLTLGFGDEVAAGMRAGVHRIAGGLGLIDEPRQFSEIYDEGLNEARGLLDQAWERNPGPALAGTVAGGLLPVTATMGGSAPLSAPGMVRAAGVGAAGGALGGFGAGEGFEDRLDNAAFGGAIGGAAGPLVLGAGNVLGSAIRGVTGNRGTAAVGDVLRRDNLSPDEVLSELERRVPEGRGETIMDIAGPGSNTMDLAGVVGNTPNPRLRAMTETLQERVDEAPARIADDFREAFGGADRNFYASIDELDAARRRAAAPLYQAAYEAGAEITSPEVVGLIGTRVEPSVIRQAERLMRLDGIQPPRIIATDDGVSVSGTLSLEFVDYIKRALDDQITSGMRAGNNRLVRGLEGVRQDLLSAIDEIDNVGSLYAQARSAWAGPSELIDAMEGGRTFLGRDPNVLRRELRAMGDSERDAFATGAYEALVNRITSQADGRDVTRRVWGNQRMRDQLQTVIEAIAENDEQAEAIFARLNDVLTREHRIAQTRNFVVGNSATARRQAAEEQLSPGTMGAMLDLATGASGLPTALGAVTGGMRSLRQGARDRLRGSVGEILMETDPQPLRQRLSSELGGGTGLLSIMGASPIRQLPAFGLLGQAANDQDLPPLLRAYIN